MAILLVACVAASTLAFGAVYPWGYLPLFAGAASLGILGVVRAHGVKMESRLIGAVLAVLLLASSSQLIPLSRRLLTTISPMAPQVFSEYDLAFSGGTTSHTLSIDPQATLLGILALFALGIYLVGLPGLISSSVLRKAPGLLILFSVSLAVFSIIQREHANGLVYWFWKPVEGGGSDAFGPFVNRNHYAGWMLMSVSLAIGYWIGKVESGCKRLTSSWHQRILWLASYEASTILATGAAVVAMAISLIWPMSRSGIVSFAAAVGCFIWLVATRNAMGTRKRLLALGAIVLVLAVGVGRRGPDRILSWFADTTDVESRLAAWHDGWRAFSDFPVAGTGLNTFGVAMLFYQKSNDGYHLGRAHNDYLQLLAEGGLLVAIPAAIAIVALVVSIRRNLNAAYHESRGYWIRAGAAVGLAAIAVQETADFSLQIPANAFLFCTLAALALAPVDRLAILEKS